MTTASGGRSGGARASKYTTPRKRKTKRDSDESDAENYMTEDDSPTKKTSVQRGGGTRASGGRGRGNGRGGRGGRRSIQNPIKLGKCIRKSDNRLRESLLSSDIQTARECIATKYFYTNSLAEEAFPDMLADPFGADTFEKDAAEAAELRQISEQDPFAASESNVSMAFQEFTPINSHRTLSGFNMSNTSNFNFDNGLPTSGLGIGDMMAARSMSPQKRVVPSMGLDGGDVNASGGRARSARKASAQASEGVAAFIRSQKQEDEAAGEKSSGEDSKASEYHDLDNEEV